MNEESLSSSSTPIDSTQAVTGSEYLPTEDSSQFVSEGVALSVDESFAPALIEQLPQMSVEQLLKLENLLTREFSELSKAYVEARKGRVSTLLKRVDAQIKVCQDNDAEWTDIYLLQLSLLEDYVSHPKRAMLFPEEFQEFLDSVKLPWELDDLFSERKVELPFADYFLRIIQPHLKELMAINNGKNYELAFLDQLAEKNRVILWNQCRYDMIEYKEKLVRQTYEELAKLHRDYFGVDANESFISLNKSYYRSVVPLGVSEAKEPSHQVRLASDNIDSFNDIDNTYCKNNRIQNTSSKYDILASLNTFDREQSLYKIPQQENARVKLAGCLGLNDSDINADLQLLRRCSHKRPVENNEMLAGDLQHTKPRSLLYKDVLQMNQKQSQMKLVPIDGAPASP